VIITNGIFGSFGLSLRTHLTPFIQGRIRLVLGNGLEGFLAVSILADLSKSVRLFDPIRVGAARWACSPKVQFREPVNPQSSIQASERFGETFFCRDCLKFVQTLEMGAD